jgi:hypothetical protein
VGLLQQTLIMVACIGSGRKTPACLTTTDRNKKPYV